MTSLPHTPCLLLRISMTGYNASVFAYGNTGSGKTYTMMGELFDEGEKGILSRAVEDVFNHVEREGGGGIRVKVGFVEVYGDEVRDLLQPGRVVVREDAKGSIVLEGASEEVVKTPSEVLAILERGAALRTTGITRMNQSSSRSHAICTVVVERRGEDDGMTRGKLHLVDLAGSERAKRTGAVGTRFQEGIWTNQVRRCALALNLRLPPAYPRSHTLDRGC
jgi:hypothetical protein